MEFKGTKGEWSLPHFASNHNAKEQDGFSCKCGYVCSEYHLGAICEVLHSPNIELSNGDNPPLEEAIYNALLISKAPKLLEMLSSCKLVFDRMELQEPTGLTELMLRHKRHIAENVFISENDEQFSPF